MAVATLVVSTSKRSTVTATSQQINIPMLTNRLYALTSTTACYIKQGANPTATAGDASSLVAAGGTVVVHGGDGAVLAVIRASADGECTLTQINVQ